MMRLYRPALGALQSVVVEDQAVVELRVLRGMLFEGNDGSGKGERLLRLLNVQLDCESPACSKAPRGDAALSPCRATPPRVPRLR